jgi:hypothetical protein
MFLCIPVELEIFPDPRLLQVVDLFEFSKIEKRCRRAVGSVVGSFTSFPPVEPMESNYPELIQFRIKQPFLEIKQCIRQRDVSPQAAARFCILAKGLVRVTWQRDASPILHRIVHHETEWE